MKRLRLQVHCPTGSLLIGGWTAAAGGFDAASATDPMGAPIVPASALRGALRETLERLLRGAEKLACSGGDGVDPVTGTGESGRCKLVDEGPCDACRLFGSQNEGSSPVLSLSEATADGGRVETQPRHGVAVTRSRRSAEDKKLFTWALAPPGGQLTFHAEGSLDPNDESLEALLNAAVIGTTHIGRGRSRGLGRVDMCLVDPLRKPEVQPWFNADENPHTVRVLVELTSPGSIGLALPPPTVYDTRDYIPGSAFRGALGFALAEAGHAHDASFAQLFDEEEGAVFDPFYPVDDLDASTPPAPWPLTARRCKFDPGHPVIDTLIDRIIHHLSGNEFVGSFSRCGWPECGAPLDRPEGVRRFSALPPTQVATRVSLDRATGSAKEKLLYTQILLQPGTFFEGSIRRIPPGTVELLDRGLREPLRVGRGRSRGWGRVAIKHVKAATTLDLTERATAFDDKLRAELESAGIDTTVVGQLVPMTLLSSLLVSDASNDGRVELAASLGVNDVEWPVVARRFDVEAGWDQRPDRRERRDLCHSTDAGGVFVADLGRGCTWRDVIGVLARLEENGAGLRTFQGYGRVLCFDPFILRREF